MTSNVFIEFSCFENIENMDQIFDEIQYNLNNNLIENLIQNLKIITIELKIQDNRIKLNEKSDNWIVLSQILTHICHQIDGQNKCVFNSKIFFELIIELFRVLRNSLINCIESKQSILTNGSVFGNSLHVFNHLFEFYKNLGTEDLIPRHRLIQSIKCCLQFWANLLSGLSEERQDLTQIRDKIWTSISFDLFRYLL